MIERKSCVICKKPDGQEDHECMQWLIDEVKRLNALVCELEAYNYELQFQANLIDDGWVSVNDRLPPINRDVLIKYKGRKDPLVAMLRDNGDSMYFSTIAWNVGVKAVEYWIPLPTPKERT